MLQGKETSLRCFQWVGKVQANFALVYIQDLQKVVSM